MADAVQTTDGIDRLKGIKVLVVEDDPMISEVILKELSKSGCELCSTDNGTKAVPLAEECKPDVIILDLMLPGMSGERVLLDLKEHPQLKTIPVIVFSNRSEDSDITKVKALGAAEFFVKVSTGIHELIGSIERLVKKTA